jgi:signal transduction histidine kinase/CheY-like chemotaxis protein
MDVTWGKTDFREELADLQRDAMKTIMFSIAPIGYIWLYVNIWLLPRRGFSGHMLTSSWIGAGLLLLSATLGYVLRNRHLHLATHLYTWGLLVTVASIQGDSPLPGIVYLFVLPVIFASVLLSRPGFFLVAVVAASLTLNTALASAGAGPLGARLLSAGAMLPVAVILFVTLACWLSSRSLYTALAWVWSGYERALHNEQVARERQAELRRALKALDEATHRLERTNYMLALARDQAEEARRLKQQFAQTISHELRTPLNLIVGFTELMAEAPEYYDVSFTPAYLRDLSIVYRNACHLQNLVSDVLDLARIEAAQMSILLEEAEPAALVREALDTVHSLVEARGLALHIEVEPDLPLLYVDPVRIRQVLFNLLNNAVRFTDQGSITVSAYRQGGEVVFAVADTGTGIAPEDISRVFEEFQQVDGSMRRRHGGAGLGLAISRRFVELHHGRIWVESWVGRGSTFYFSLPAERADLLDASEGRIVQLVSSEAVPAGGSEEPILLAVTRSPSAATLLTRYVRDCRTVVVSGFEEARRVAQDVMPQAVVIDRTGEQVDGLKLEALAQEWGLHRIPFIVAPLHGEELLRQHLAVDGYLVKPISRQVVWDLMRRFGGSVDNVLIVDDDHDFVRLLGRMLEESPVRRYQVSGAYGGQQALLQMRQHQPDIVLLDLGLPDLDGRHVIKRIRSNLAWQHIPIVIVSAQEEVDRRESLSGAVTVVKAEGLMPGEVVRWVQAVIDTSITSLPAPAALKIGPASKQVFPETP